MNMRSVSATLLCMAYAAAAATTPDQPTTLLACRGLTDTATRLACFDRESAALALALAAAPPAPPAPPALTPEQTFGLSRIAIAEQESPAARRSEVAEVQARLVGLRLRADGRSELTLDNNQVWRQLNSGEELLLKEGDSVRLSRGVLSSYWLATPSGRSCKVTRVR